MRTLGVVAIGALCLAAGIGLGALVGRGGPVADAPGAALDRVSALESSNARLRSEVERLQATIGRATRPVASPVPPANPEATDPADTQEEILVLLQGAPSEWRAAYAVGTKLAAYDSALVLGPLRDAWPRIGSRTARQQILKAVHVARPPWVLHLLKLGMDDADPQVREWARGYLEDYAFRDFEQPGEAFEDWWARFGDRPLDEVRRENAAGYVARLRSATALQAEALGRSVREVNGWQGSNVRVLLDAGLGEVIDAWLAAPEDEFRTAGLAALSAVAPAAPAVLARPGLLDQVATLVLSGPEAQATDALRHLLYVVILASGDSASEMRGRVIGLLGRVLTEGSDSRVLEALQLAQGTQERIEDRKAMASLLPAIERLIETGSPVVASAAIRTLPGLRPDEAYLRQVLTPLLVRDPERRQAVLRGLASRKHDWAIDLVLPYLEDPEQGVVWAAAGALAQMKAYRAIPAMIEAIKRDNAYKTIYGVGYFGLGDLTNVSYDESHDGAWWERWWQENRGQYEGR